ncbi:hypothetical protein [Haloparvum sp. PAK95]|uniref:hypothetical protein n=1 Tax=Haloparvum sp. PAK95 TaxID=3418962 RepID=UPI003D2F18CB
MVDRYVMPLQMPGGPEMFVVFIVYVLMGFVPLVLAAAAIYLLYRIRQDTQSMATSLERLAAEGSSPADVGERDANDGGSTREVE